MPLHETTAFVLRTYTLKEADKICVFFTRDAGMLRGVAHGARKLKSRFGASLEPFTEVALAYFEKEHRDLVSVSGCEILQSQFASVTSSEMLGVLHYLAELAIEFLPDHEPNERVYRLTGATLKALRHDRSERWPALIRYFEVWLLRLAGFFPDLQNCGLCRRDLEREASVWLTEETAPRCAACADRHGVELRPDVRRMIREIGEQSPTRFIQTAREGRALAQIAGLTSRLIQRALERELKSYELLGRLKPAV
jgi:DNA repair protein RecO (recombination protein O)